MKLVREQTTRSIRHFHLPNNASSTHFLSPLHFLKNGHLFSMSHWPLVADSFVGVAELSGTDVFAAWDWLDIGGNSGGPGPTKNRIDKVMYASIRWSCWNSYCTEDEELPTRTKHCSVVEAGTIVERVCRNHLSPKTSWPKRNAQSVVKLWNSSSFLQR